MIRWGIMATGTIARKFALTLNTMNDPQNVLKACASRTEEKAQAFAGEFGIDLAYGSYQALAASDEVDAIYICTPNDSHGELTRLCLEHGKHVLCEKPFTPTAKEAEELYALAEQKGLFLMEALWTYHLPAVRKAQELIAAGAIGRVRWLSVDYGFVAKGARRERKFRSELGGGALLDIGIYNLAFANQMLDGDMASFEGKPQLNEFGTDWFSHLTLRYPGDVEAAMTTTIGMELPRRGVVAGTEGRIVFDDFQMAQRFTLTPYGGEEQVFELPFDVNGFEYQIRETAACIEKGSSFSEVYPPEKSIARMRELEEIRRGWGMRFSFEE